MPTTKPWLTSYAEGVPHEIPEPTGTLLDLVTASATAHPEAVALEFFGAETSYRELVELIDRAAGSLRQLGVKAGDHVAIILPNCPQHIIAFYAALRLGARVIEHNPLYTPREMRHQFEDHGAKFVIAWDKVVGTLQDLPEDVRPAHIVSVNLVRAMPLKMRFLLALPISKARESRAALTTSVTNTIPWDQVVKADRIAADIATPQVDDIALLQYTTGTTGSPKAAILTHRNLLANAAQARAWIPQVTAGPVDGRTVYAVLPMFHAYGLTLCLTLAMSISARLVLFPKFDPELVLKVLKRRPATLFPAVPPIYAKTMAAAKEQGVSLRGTRIGISGAMPLPSDVVEPWEALTGGYLVEGYGLSECSPVLTANPVADHRRVGTIGLPLPSTEIRIIDRDDPTVEVPLGQEGELVARGPQVFQGYFNRPEETAKVFVPATDGGADWFRTGDIAVMDADGFIRIVDRIKELIITGGFNVAPSEVEDAIRRHPAIADIAVVGLPDGTQGERVVGAVVLEPGQAYDEEEVREFARGVLAAYKVPRRLFVVDELPRSLIGKVLRKDVRESLLARE